VSQDASLKDGPEATGKFFSHEQVQEHMTCPKEETGNSQDSGYSTAPEAMVKFGRMSPPSHALVISLFTQYARTQGAPEAMGKFSSHEQVQEHMTCPKESKGNSQDSGYNTAPEAMVKFGRTSPPSHALVISLFTQDARTQGAPEAMGKFSSHEQVQEQMTCPREAKGSSKDSGYSTAPEAMVKFGQMIPPSQALAIRLFNQDARTQDVPEAMGFFSSHEQVQEQMPLPKEANGNSQDSGYSVTLEAMVKFGQMIPPPLALAISLSPQDAKTQDALEAMVKFSSHEEVQEQMTLPKEEYGISQESRYNTAPEAMVEYGQTSPPSQALSTSPFTQDSRNQDAPEAMPKIEGRNSMAELLWTIVQNKAAKVVR
jgi:uncharacterized protein YyaL (SSP411 family)